MTVETDPYSILGLSVTATLNEIKTAYRQIARRMHPDANPNHPGAALQFTDITAAHELLTDPVRKRTVDERLRKRGQSDEIFFNLRVTPSKRIVTPMAEHQVIYMLADIAPDPRARSQEHSRETRLNLTLVLDRSNSMSGNRLEKVKIAAHQIIDSLTSEDIISVVTFHDRAEVIIPATYVKDKPALKARISMMAASGATAIYQGLSSGVDQNRQFQGPRLVNHVILLTDGHTYGDQEPCLELSAHASQDGIGISAMGLGHDWNDEFLDAIASKTGGTSAYISSAGAVVEFLNDHVRHLSNAFAERVRLSVAPDPDVELELAFKLSPHAQPLPTEDGLIQLGGLLPNRPISVLLQFQLPGNMEAGFRTVARLVSSGDILINNPQGHQVLSDILLEVAEDAAPEEPPPAIMDALSKLTLYRLQERAQEALDRGDIGEATRRLENLRTRLLEMGEDELAGQVQLEAHRVTHTKVISEKGHKTIKYGTRSLLLSSVLLEETSSFNDNA